MIYGALGPSFLYCQPVRHRTKKCRMHPLSRIDIEGGGTVYYACFRYSLVTVYTGREVHVGRGDMVGAGVRIKLDMDILVFIGS